MAYEGLHKELKEITTEKYATALSHVLFKQGDVAEGRDMLRSFAEEFPVLAGASEVISLYAEEAGVTAHEKNLVATGYLAGLMALKEMVDTDALEGLPTLDQ